MSRARIHGYSISTWTRTVHMVCIEKGVEHELVPVAYGKPEHAALHPFMRIPILEVDEIIITETMAITGYLDEAFPGPSLQPEDLRERTLMRMWMSVCGDYLYRDVVRTIPRDRPPSEDELATARTALERADRLVPRAGFLAGGTVTLADLYLAPQLANCHDKAPELLAEFGGLVSWLQFIAGRESFQRSGH